jgi:hypothetical protein
MSLPHPVTSPPEASAGPRLATVARQIVEVAGNIATSFNKKVEASRSRNKELGDAASLMQYIIGGVGWVTRTPDCESSRPSLVGERQRLTEGIVTRSTVICLAFTGGAVAIAMLFDHPM